MDPLLCDILLGTMHHSKVTPAHFNPPPMPEHHSYRHASRYKARRIALISRVASVELSFVTLKQVLDAFVDSIDQDLTIQNNNVPSSWIVTARFFVR